MTEKIRATPFDRRVLLSALPLAGASMLAARALAAVPGVGAAAPSPQAAGAAADRIHLYFPSQEPEGVREMVGVSHGNIARVRELLAERPSLALATWDWGWGDWESALDAASHMGNREIAELLLAHGARPTHFCAAMLGQLAVVKAAIEARPGLQRTRGPHGLTLMAHAKAGGPAAAAVVAYLATVRDADPQFPLVPIVEADGAKLTGWYEFGPESQSRFEVTQNNGQLQIQRPGGTARRLLHLGEREFFPSAIESVRIRIEVEADGAGKLTIRDGGHTLIANRRPR